MNNDWHYEMELICDYKEDGPLSQPLKEYRFSDVFGTEHTVFVSGKDRYAARNSIKAHFIPPWDGNQQKYLIRLPEPTTNGVLEVWVGMERFQ